MEAKQLKMENPARIAELKPMETLIRIGLKDNDAVCDVGAGSGIFTVAAAQLTKNKVYALETDDRMLEVIGEKAGALGAANIETIKVEGDQINLSDQSADILLLVTVLHEIENKPAFLTELKRLLKSGGRILIIEFHGRETPLGPPVSHRIKKEEVKKILADFGFVVAEEHDLGDNFYDLIFQLHKGDK